MPQDQDNQKNLLLAIVLSVGVLIFWQMFYAGPKLKEEQERRTRVQQEQTQAQPGAAPTTAAPGVTPQPGVAVPPGGAASPALTRTAAVDATPRVRIDTPSLRGSISLTGGRIDDLVLVKYRETTDPNSPNVELLSPSGAPHPYYAEYGWVAASGTPPLPGPNTVWQQEKPGQLTPDSPVTLVWNNGQGLIFRRTIAVDADYLFTVTNEVQNTGSAEITLHPYSLISRHGTPPTSGYIILHEGPIGVIGETLHEPNYADLLKDGGAKTFKQQTGGWLGITDKYWAAALIPDQKAQYTATFSGRKGAKDTYQTDLLMAGLAVPPGGKATSVSNLFAGAKQVSLIEAYEAKLQANKLNLLVDWGWFWFITKPLFKLLHWLSQMLGNYGLAILATTVLVKAAFFPLANKSYESMAKMKKLQPEMEKIRDRFKDDRAKQQQELMALYKNEKINPMAGCLPIVVQIPVFFALYKVLFITIDMRQAPFYGWIKDLSAPDPTSLFNLFGLLPYHVPDMLHIGVWPIIMGITMWVQMQLNPQQPDPIQQKIFNWMPVIFTFMLASFPSGLVIYWAWNNVLSLLQQYAIMRRNNTEVHLWKNLGIDKWKARLASARSLVPSGAKAGAGSGSRDAAASPARKESKPARDGKGGAGVASVQAMTRTEALEALGLDSDATEKEIDTALAEAELKRSQRGLNGSDHAAAARIEAARHALRGPTSS
ncbi:MAG TPA: membrane protein insertase YidC [Hyphomicrobiaceae bacterium]|nr:membrane protein insertase YidC [Hyphomicrobiaceae bacterium]